MTQRLNLSSGISIPPLELPSLRLPEAPTMPVPTLEIPTPQIPSYKPLVVPPSDLRAPPGVKGGVNSDPPPKSAPPPPPGMKRITVPYINQDLPVPSNDIIITAGTTATVSVAATLTATAVFKRLVSLFKPIIKQAWKRLVKKKHSSGLSYLPGRLGYLRRPTQG